MKLQCLLLVVICVLASTKAKRSVADEGKVKLLMLAGNDQPGNAKSAQALQDLKELGLAKHVVPLLSERATDLESIRRQLAAARVLQRGGYSEAIAVFGHCLSLNRYTPLAIET